MKFFKVIAKNLIRGAREGLPPGQTLIVKAECPISAFSTGMSQLREMYALPKDYYPWDITVTEFKYLKA